MGYAAMVLHSGLPLTVFDFSLGFRYFGGEQKNHGS